MPAFFYRLLSDLILVIHVAFVAFIVLGFLLIWLGYFLKWGFVQNLRFRMAHLLAMGFVFIEAIVGMVCPLTTWENELRVRAGEGRAYEESFIEHWLGKIIFYDVSEHVFTALYAGFFMLVVLTFMFVPPRRKKSK